MKTLIRQTQSSVLHLFALVLLAGGLSGCGAFAPAQTFEAQLAYGYGTHTALMDAATNAVSTGTLAPEDAEQVLALSDDAKVLLDSARLAIGVGDVQTAEGQLRLATNILTQLRDYLNAQIRRSTP